MTRSEKKKLIANIQTTICLFYKALFSMPKYEGYQKDLLFVGFDVKQARKEVRRISSDLNCDTTPDYKLTAYSNRTLEILAELLSAQMTVQDIKNL